MWYSGLDGLEVVSAQKSSCCTHVIVCSMFLEFKANKQLQRWTPVLLFSSETLQWSQVVLVLRGMYVPSSNLTLGSTSCSTIVCLSSELCNAPYLTAAGIHNVHDSYLHLDEEWALSFVLCSFDFWFVSSMFASNSLANASIYRLEPCRNQLKLISHTLAFLVRLSWTELDILSRCSLERVDTFGKILGCHTFGLRCQ